MDRKTFLLVLFGVPLLGAAAIVLVDAPVLVRLGQICVADVVLREPFQTWAELLADLHPWRDIADLLRNPVTCP